MKKNLALKVEELTNKIKNIPGNKIVTLFSNDSLTQMNQYDIAENGQVGHHPSHDVLFRTKLVHALNNGGGIIIRQFTKIYDQDMPIKKIYGVYLGSGGYVGLSREKVENAHCTDAKTGKSIPKEKNVVFCGFQ